MEQPYTSQGYLAILYGQTDICCEEVNIIAENYVQEASAKQPDIYFPMSLVFWCTRSDTLADLLYSGFKRSHSDNLLSKYLANWIWVLIGAVIQIRYRA